MNEEEVDIYIARQMSWVRAAFNNDSDYLRHQKLFMESYRRAFHAAYDSGYEDGFAEGQAAKGAHSGR